MKELSFILIIFLTEIITPYTLFLNNINGALNLTRLLQSLGETFNGRLSLGYPLILSMGSKLELYTHFMMRNIHALQSEV